VIRIGNEPKVPASLIFASQREDNKERISNLVQTVLAFSAVVVVLASLFRSRICQIRSVGVTERLTRSIGLCIAMVVAIGLFKAILRC
jgi:hypothetical protein